MHWLTQHPVPLTAPPVLPPSRLCPPQSISMPGTLCGGLGSRAQILLYLSGQLCCASQFSDKACQYRRQQKQGRSNFFFSSVKCADFLEISKITLLQVNSTFAFVEVEWKKKKKNRLSKVCLMVMVWEGLHFLFFFVSFSHLKKNQNNNNSKVARLFEDHYLSVCLETARHRF